MILCVCKCSQDEVPRRTTGVRPSTILFVPGFFLDRHRRHRLLEEPSVRHAQSQLFLQLLFFLEVVLLLRYGHRHTIIKIHNNNNHGLYAYDIKTIFRRMPVQRVVPYRIHVLIWYRYQQKVQIRGLQE